MLQVPGYQVAHVDLQRGEKFPDLYGNLGGSFVLVVNSNVKNYIL